MLLLTHVLHLVLGYLFFVGKRGHWGVARLIWYVNATFPRYSSHVSLNFYRKVKHIFIGFSIISQYWDGAGSKNPFPVRKECPVFLHCHYRGSWWPGDDRSVIRHDIDWCSRIIQSEQQKVYIFNPFILFYFQCMHKCVYVRKGFYISYIPFIRIMIIG